MIKVFVSYAHADGELQKELNEHLGALRHERIIDDWYDGLIAPGNIWSEDIAQRLAEADLILLLVSSAFLNSTYCYKEEMQRAIERHNAGTARVIPIILRPCHWQPAPFAKLQGLPAGMVPVSGRPQQQRDAVWAEIAKGIHLAARAYIDSRTKAHAKVGQAEAQQYTAVNIPTTTFSPRMDPLIAAPEVNQNDPTNLEMSQDGMGRNEHELVDIQPFIARDQWAIRFYRTFAILISVMGIAVVVIAFHPALETGSIVEDVARKAGGVFLISLSGFPFMLFLARRDRLSILNALQWRIHQLRLEKAPPEDDVRRITELVWQMYKEATSSWTHSPDHRA